MLSPSECAAGTLYMTMPSPLKNWLILYDGAW